MVGIGPEFLSLLKKIEWDTLTARDAVDLRAALKEAVGKSDEWFLKLTREFRETPGEVEPIQPPSPPAAKVESGRPQVEASLPRELKPTVRARVTLKRKRGRPPASSNKQRARPTPLEIGGANAAGVEGAAQAAKLFENSYVSKDGPRADVPADLPANHPRRNLHHETSVTPEVDMDDFKTVEEAMKGGRGVKDIFQVR
jgi:hypothetical protein